MKLLLTSNGLVNKGIADALFDLVGKKPEDTSLVFIPTAMNITRGDKSWFINDLINIKKQNFKSIDIADISALPQKIWLPKFEAADVLFFCGGHTTHLMRSIKESGLENILREFLKAKVYVGISAGSIVTNPTLAFSSKDKKLYYEKEFGYKDEHGLGLVDFYIRPHLNSPDFPHVQEKYLKEMARELKVKLYALDDKTALKVVDGKVEVVGGGTVLEFN